MQSRTLSIRRDLLRAFTECVTVIGGVLIILGVAQGFTSYLVGAQVPARLVEWVRGFGAKDVIQPVTERDHGYSTPINRASPRCPVW